MELFPLVQAILVLGGLGFLFGGLLAYAATQFRVEIDPKIEQVAGLLPGANCGACGFPGCAGLANAIVIDGVPLTTCPVMNADNRKKMAEVLGVDAGQGLAKIAFVRCKGKPGEEYEKFTYRGLPGCQAAVLIGNGPKLCPHRCIGLGSCVKVCTFDAMHLDDDDLPVVDPHKCTSCGKCVQACPKNLIVLTLKDKKVRVACNSSEKGVDTRKVCPVGCIACKQCEKVCVYDAIKVENNLARIDPEKCVECGACVTKCPTKAILFMERPDFKPQKALIDEPACVGCTLCFKVCKFAAIEGGTPKAKHRILTDKCVGCGLCVSKCPKKCITMNPVS